MDCSDYEGQLPQYFPAPAEDFRTQVFYPYYPPHFSPSSPTFAPQSTPTEGDSTESPPPVAFLPFSHSEESSADPSAWRHDGVHATNGEVSADAFSFNPFAQEFVPRTNEAHDSSVDADENTKTVKSRKKLANRPVQKQGYEADTTKPTPFVPALQSLDTSLPLEEKASADFDASSTADSSVDSTCCPSEPCGSRHEFELDEASSDERKSTPRRSTNARVYSRKTLLMFYVAGLVADEKPNELVTLRFYQQRHSQGQHKNLWQQQPKMQWREQQQQQQQNQQHSQQQYKVHWQQQQPQPQPQQKWVPQQKQKQQQGQSRAAAKKSRKEVWAETKTVHAGKSGKSGRGKKEVQQIYVAKQPKAPAPTSGAYRVVKPSAHTDIFRRAVALAANKVTIENFERITDDLAALEAESVDELQVKVEVVFEKAVNEPLYAEMYACLCEQLHVRDDSEFSMQEGDDVVQANFRRLLLHHCQAQFEQLQQADRERALSKPRAIGTVRFIGELFKKKLLPIRVVQRVAEALVESDEQLAQVCCALLTTCGATLDRSKHGHQLLEIVMPKLEAIACSKQTRFLVDDLLELRQRGWEPRRQEDKPQPLQQLRQAELERGVADLLQRIKCRRDVQSALPLWDALTQLHRSEPLRLMLEMAVLDTHRTEGAVQLLPVLISRCSVRRRDVANQLDSLDAQLSQLRLDNPHADEALGRLRQV